MWSVIENSTLSSHTNTTTSHLFCTQSLLPWDKAQRIKHANCERLWRNLEVHFYCIRFNDVVQLLLISADVIEAIKFTIYDSSKWLIFSFTLQLQIFVSLNNALLIPTFSIFFGGLQSFSGLNIPFLYNFKGLLSTMNRIIEQLMPIIPTLHSYFSPKHCWAIFISLANWNFW